ncbi:MAG: F0F1 ATP synthase subunit delta [Gemmobacter sp.]
MSDSLSISSGIAARYAQALFELAKDSQALPVLDTDTDALDAVLTKSADLRDLISSPLYSREDQGAAMSAVVAKMGLSPLFANTIALMAQKRRLFVLPQLVARLRDLIATEKGQITAEVTSAIALTEAQMQALSDTIKARVGRDVKLKTAVDDTLIGGLVVKVGSTMIDSSIRAKLASLQNAMKEVG